MPAPIPTNVDGLFGYQFHQLAMFYPSKLRMLSALDHWRTLGYNNWITDRAELKGLLWGEEVITKATMHFNYDIMPMELELLHYEGPSRWSTIETYRKPFPSHMSVYTEDVFSDTQALTDTLGPPFHRFITQNHSNPGVAGKKRFIESIFTTHDLLGYDTKLIQKVPHDYDDNLWLDATF